MTARSNLRVRLNIVNLVAIAAALIFNITKREHTFIYYIRVGRLQLF